MQFPAFVKDNPHITATVNFLLWFITVLFVIIQLLGGTVWDSAEAKWQDVLDNQKDIATELEAHEKSQSEKELSEAEWMGSVNTSLSAILKSLDDIKSDIKELRNSLTK